MNDFDKLQEELNREIVDFIGVLKEPLLKEIHNSPTTILGIKSPGIPNPFSSYLHAKLQQEARDHPEHSALSDAYYQMVDPNQNGIAREHIYEKIVIAVEENYNGSTHAFLNRLTNLNPLAIFYAVAKSPRLIEVYKSGSKNTDDHA